MVIKISKITTKKVMNFIKFLISEEKFRFKNLPIWIYNRRNCEAFSRASMCEGDSLLKSTDVCKMIRKRERKNRQLADTGNNDNDNNDDEDNDWTDAAMDLRRDALRQGPPFHGRLVLHILDLLLQCVLVHGGEYTGIHGYSRTPLVANRERDGACAYTGKSIRTAWE